MISLQRPQKASPQRGFTLTELAIVLGGMGLVMAAIWAIAGVVWGNSQAYRATQQLVTLVQNVRDYYGPMGMIRVNATAPFFAADGTNITTVLDDDKRRLIPIEMRVTPNDSGNGINHALATTGVAATNGSLQVFADGFGSRFRVLLRGLKKNDCIKFLPQFPILMPEMGVYSYQGNSGGVTVVNLAPVGGTAPLTVNTALPLCDLDRDNQINFTFKLRN